MGAKIFVAFIKDAGETEINSKLVQSLGFKDFDFTGKTTFAWRPDCGELFIASNAGNLLVANPDLIWQFTNPEITKTEKLFIELFPKNDIAIINLGYGIYFSVIENGKKIRVRAVGDEIYQDVGELLPEEKYLLTTCLIDENELFEMQNQMTAEEIENEYQSRLAYDTAFELTKRFFGKRCDELWPTEYEFESYRFQNNYIDSVQDYRIKAQMQFIQ